MWISSRVRRRVLRDDEEEEEVEAEVVSSADGLREVEEEGPAEKVPPEELLPLLYVIVCDWVAETGCDRSERLQGCRMMLER